MDQETPERLVVLVVVVLELAEPEYPGLLTPAVVVVVVKTLLPDPADQVS